MGEEKTEEELELETLEVETRLVEAEEEKPVIRTAKADYYTKLFGGGK